MQQEKYDIFISYRRKDENGKEWGTSIARNVLQGLEDRGYKGRVFFDHNKIGPEDFEKKILGAIKQAKVFLCILTKNAMDNCVNEGDWVRREICQAIESGLKIIFLNPDNEFNHNLLPDNFPKEIEIVKTQNSIEIRSGQKFEVDIDDMVKRYISKIVPCQNILSANSQSSDPMGMMRIKTDLDCIVFNYGEEVGVVNVGEYEKLLLPIGENLLKFVSQECEDVFYEQKIKVEKDFQQFIDVKLVSIYNTYNATKEKDRQIYLLNLPDDDFDWFYEDGKYGFRLKSTDEIVISPQYDDIANRSNVFSNNESPVVKLLYAHPSLKCFHEGLVAVKKDNLWGYINKVGKVVIPMKYDAGSSFLDGLARVKLNGKYGFVDKTGKEIIPLKYDDVILPWRANSLPVKIKDKWGMINDNGHLITPVKYDAIQWDMGVRLNAVRVRIKDRYGWVNLHGKEVVSPKFDYFISEEILKHGWEYKLKYMWLQSQIATKDFFKTSTFGFIVALLGFGLIVIADYISSPLCSALCLSLGIIVGCVGLGLVYWKIDS